MLRRSIALVLTSITWIATVTPVLPESAVELVRQMTLEEKASLVTGQNFWQTAEVPRLGIPPAWMADGPVGLRKSAGAEVSESLPATCFPSSAAMAATWNPELIERLGAAIGTEASFHDVTLLLAPGLNLKRHPLGGRNFEYYSEDPLLSGKIAAAFVRGVQSEGVGATLKHFAVNNQETRRMTIDAVVDEQSLRELYLRGFEIAIEEGRPQAIMSAYNRVNGTYASQSQHLLSEVLRGEWGYSGMVVSDWGAVDDPASSVAAGLDLEMPGNPTTPPAIVRAVEEGTLSEADLDLAVARVLQLVDRAALLAERPKREAPEEHHELAREVAAESLVLLANDGTLPFDAARPRRIAVAGRLAFAPRIQGIGSSQINTTRTDAPWPEVEELAHGQGHDVVAWQADYAEGGLTDAERESFVELLGDRDVALIFAGQPASHDAEAWDRPSMSLAEADLELIAAAAGSGKTVVVVLTGGGAMDLRPFHDDASALLMGWLGGQAFGSAVARVLFGEESPSGRLSETFAWAAADHVSDLNFPGDARSVVYGERLYVGYRYFQTVGREVAYPFGHGLSYTTFDYAAARAPEALDFLDFGFDVEVDVTNTGERAGAEVVQLYLRRLDAGAGRPDRELIGFTKVWVEPGATVTATVHVDKERLDYFDTVHERWVTAPGDYELLVAASAADVRHTLPLRLTTGTVPPVVYTLDHTLGELLDDPQGRAAVDFMTSQGGRTPLSETPEDDFMGAIFKNLPFKKLVGFSGGKVSVEQLQQVLLLVNSEMDPQMVSGILQQAASGAAAAEADSETRE